MKAIIISSLLFFSLKAMSAQVGEDKKSECSASVQTSTRSDKVVEVDTSSTENKSPAVKTISK